MLIQGRFYGGQVGHGPIMPGFPTAPPHRDVKVKFSFNVLR